MRKLGAALRTGRIPTRRIQAVAPWYAPETRVVPARYAERLTLVRAGDGVAVVSSCPSSSEKVGMKGEIGCVAMARSVRNNLMVDGDAPRALARRRGTSESEAARTAIAAALATTDMLAAFEELHEMNAFADFEALYPRLDQGIDDSAPG